MEPLKLKDILPLVLSASAVLRPSSQEAMSDRVEVAVVNDLQQLFGRLSQYSMALP